MRAGLCSGNLPRDCLIMCEDFHAMTSVFKVAATQSQPGPALLEDKPENASKNSVPPTLCNTGGRSRGHHTDSTDERPLMDARY